MTRNSKCIIGTAALILMVSFFLPSRLTSNDWGTIVAFAKTGNIGFAPYILLLFPITFGLILTRKLTAAFIVSTILLLTNTTLFENLLCFIFNIPDKTFLRSLDRVTPFLTYSAIFIGLIYKAFKKDSWVWYGIFICLMVVSYIWFNNNNCTLIFISDLGIRTSDFRIWFQNCGTYYAWWTASLLLNIGLFNEMKTAAGNR